jgi:outer membrane receptor protein involved in Fe transport
VAVHWEIEAGGAGTLAFENFLTYTDEWRVQAVSGDPALKCEGKWGGDCVGTVIPEIRNYLRVTWATPWNVDISGRWRHIGAVDPIDEGREHISAHDYLDLTVIWKITGFATLRAGMNNVFDKEPPVALGDPPVSNGNTLPGVYDALGRYWFAGLTVEF